MKKFLRMARRAQHAKEIADALERGGLKRPGDNVLSGILVRAAKGREIIKVGKGTWGLSEWYPNRRQAEPAVKARPKRTPKAKKAAAPKRQEKRPGSAPVSDDITVNGHSERGALAGILREVLGAPTHVKDITSAINARGRTVTRGTVEGLLNRWVSQGKARKTAAGTFAAL